MISLKFKQIFSIISIILILMLFPLISEAQYDKPELTDVYFEQQAQILHTGDVLKVIITGKNIESCTVSFCSDPLTKPKMHTSIMRHSNPLQNGEIFEIDIQLPDNLPEVRYRMSNVILHGTYSSKSITNCLSSMIDDKYFTLSNNCYNGIHVGGKPTPSKKAVCDICGTEYGDKYLKAVVLNSKNITMQAGTSSTALKIKEKNSGDKVSQWLSSNPDVASINKKSGKIDAKKPGTTNITVKMKSGVKATCKLKVVSKPVKIKKISFPRKYCFVEKGEKIKLKIKKDPITYIGSLQYTSSRPKYATVNKNGVVTGKKVGTTDITVTAPNGVKAVCTIKVE